MFSKMKSVKMVLLGLLLLNLGESAVVNNKAAPPQPAPAKGNTNTKDVKQWIVPTAATGTTTKDGTKPISATSTPSV
jgi:hypothetical protein